MFQKVRNGGKFLYFLDRSVTYKLKLNGGDIKAVQGDSGHAQVNMVTDVYSHILDEDRKKNAELFEEAFYGNKETDPQMNRKKLENSIKVPEGVDAELLERYSSIRRWLHCWYLLQKQLSNRLDNSVVAKFATVEKLINQYSYDLHCVVKFS